MAKTFLIADTHFSHKNICVYNGADGKKERPWDDCDQMDRDMTEMWNDTVKESDKVYILGDVAIPRRGLQVLKNLNGKKCLIKGNHDIFKLSDYTEHFYDVRGYMVLDGVIFSHVPIHPSQIQRFGCNIHGHLHSGRVMKDVINTYACIDHNNMLQSEYEIRQVIDPNYFCVSAEHTGFKPMLLEDVYSAVIAQGGTIGFRNGNGSNKGAD